MVNTHIALAKVLSSLTQISMGVLSTIDSMVILFFGKLTPKKSPRFKVVANNYCIFLSELP